MDAGEILKSFGIGLSRALRYLFPGFLLLITLTIADPSRARLISDTIGWQLSTLCAIVMGVGVYVVHRRLVIPCHHLLGCFILWIGDKICHVEPKNSLSPTRWFRSLNSPVPRYRRMLAYDDLRRQWFKQAEDRERVNVQHAENGLPVMISEAIVAISVYSQIVPDVNPVWSLDVSWSLVSAFMLFFFSAVSGMQEHRIECAHFKANISRVDKILKKFQNS